MSFIQVILYGLFFVSFLKLIHEMDINKIKFIALASISFLFEAFPNIVSFVVSDDLSNMNMPFSPVYISIFSILSIIVFVIIFSFLLPKELYKQKNEYIIKRAKRIRNGSYIILSNIIANILFILSITNANFLVLSAISGIAAVLLNIFAVVSFFDVWISLYKVRKNLEESKVEKEVLA